SALYRRSGAFLWAGRCIRSRLSTLEPSRRKIMTWLQIASAVIAVGLLIYLVAALLNPEDFS
ncbi:MAG TPA: K(+)-transporting ATPase subunit F, partial [Rhodocyclaceae bacterium]|nr:K(+)-transporting ATPase subunit F [Rhodocyclaceae bacterium]